MAIFLRRYSDYTRVAVIDESRGHSCTPEW
jgi:hypothetical protein